jgi:hypothetical protein
MPIDLTVPRQQIEAYLMPDTCIIETPTQPLPNGRGGTLPGVPIETSSICGLSAVSGEEATDDLIRVRGNYRLRLPVGTAIVEGATVILNGRRYRAVWVPHTHGLSLTQRVGLEAFQ